MVLLESERMIFREHRITDLPEFIRMNSDPEFRRFVGGRRWPVWESKRRFRDDFLGRPKALNDACAIELKENGAYIGYGGLVRKAGSAEAALVFHFTPEYWGKGLATELARAFIEAGFRDLGLTKITAEVERGNEASVRINGKIGLHLVREEETPQRTVLHFELAKEDWEAL